MGKKNSKRVKWQGKKMVVDEGKSKGNLKSLWVKRVKGRGLEEN